MQGKVNKNFVGAKSFFYFILCIGYFCIGLFSIVGFYKFIFFFYRVDNKIKFKTSVNYFRTYLKFYPYLCNVL